MYLCILRILNNNNELFGSKEESAPKNKRKSENTEDDGWKSERKSGAEGFARKTGDLSTKHEYVRMLWYVPYYVYCLVVVHVLVDKRGLTMRLTHLLIAYHITSYQASNASRIAQSNHFTLSWLLLLLFVCFVFFPWKFFGSISLLFDYDRQRARERESDI